MIERKIKVLSLLFVSLFLTGCDDARVFEQTGEWQYEDVMYIKNQGTSEHKCDPIGWITIDGKKVNCKLDRQPGRQVDFLYYDIENDIVGDRFCRADATLLWSGDIRLEILKDKTKTYSKNTSWILVRIK